MKRPQKISLSLACVYTSEEMDEKRDRLSASILEYDKCEDEKAEVAKTYNENLKALRVEMRSLSRAINRKGEDRPVDCVVEFHNPEIGFKTTIRTDTGEIVRQEPMTDDERQENLFEETDALSRMYDAPDTREIPPPPPETNNDHEGDGA
jgi:hypothetical protein